jgi:copper resistance protein B
MKRFLNAAALTGFVSIWFAAPVEAQMAMGGPSAAAPFGAPMDDEHIFYHILFDQLEGRFGRDGSFRWEGEGWAGTDMNRVVLKTEGTVTKGVMEEGDQELLYARPISTYFNVQGGVRYDLDSAPGRGWAAFGIEGLAPLFFHVSATGYVSDRGHLAGKLEGNYDLLLTQTLILQPQLEMNFYSKDDPARMIGSGLSDLDAGLRLRYEITRKLAPYIGVTYENKLGDTARFARSAGERVSDLRFSAGVRIWF